jgi:hypothetical protein
MRPFAMARPPDLPMPASGKQPVSRKQETTSAVRKQEKS